VQTLYLSKNSIRQLSRLQQFSGLRVLSLADNLVADVSALDQLGALAASLEAVSLRGSPLAAQPHYRSHVIAALPALRMLDNRQAPVYERLALSALPNNVYLYVSP
jgi:Leucine-rich repeat (LRR) protein